MVIANMQSVEALQAKVEHLENQLRQLTANMESTAAKVITNNSLVIERSQMQYGLYTALCIDTIDIWKQNRILFKEN